MTARYPCGSSAVANKACCIDNITNHEVLIGAAKVVVHILERVHDNGFLYAACVEGNKDGDRKDGEQQASCLVGRKSSGRDRTPRFVDRVFDDGLWQTLVRQIKYEYIDPDPKYHQWYPLKDSDSIW